MALEKITEAQMNANGVIAAPDVLNGTAAENKAIFDRMVRSVVAPAYNACVDAVNALTALEDGMQAAENERRTAEAERVKAELERAAAELKRAAAEAERVAAEAQRQDLETGFVARAEKAAKDAEEWAQKASGDMKANVYDPNGVEAPVAFRPSFNTLAMLAANWTGNTYSFEETYSHADYNISVEVAPTATMEQFEAFGAAMICGSADSNVATALGDVPTVDIPIIVKAVAK